MSKHSFIHLPQSQERLDTYSESVIEMLKETELVLRLGPELDKSNILKMTKQLKKMLNLLTILYHQSLF